MELMFDPLLNPYHFADETDSSALTPQEIQELRKTRNHDAAKNLRRNVPE